eukprot:204870_1
MSFTIAHLYLLLTQIHFLNAHNCEESMLLSTGTTVANWINGLFMQDTGAIFVHQDVGYYDSNNIGYHRSVPYYSGIALRGLLQWNNSEYIQMATKWLDWYSQHALNGITLDHWYKDDDIIGTTCPPGLSPSNPSCNNTDADDSTAAMYIAISGLVSHYNNTILTMAYQTLQSLSDIQYGNMTNAKHDWPIVYTMDNVEVFWAVNTLNNHNSFYLFDSTAIDTFLMNSNGNYYKIAATTDSNISAQFYPDTTAQIWPLLFNHSPNISADMNRWNEIKNIWTCYVYGNESCNSWPSIGYFATLIDDNDIACIHFRNLRERYFMDPQNIAPDWPFTVADGGWYLMLIDSLLQQYRNVYNTTMDIALSSTQLTQSTKFTESDNGYIVCSKAAIYIISSFLVIFN